MRTTKKLMIINVSIDLFADKGISRISITRIANRAGLSRSAIYYHFKGGKNEIVAAIIQVFETCVSSSIPDPKEWENKDADAGQILFKLFFRFPSEDALRLRKIVRIIMSEMYHDEQIMHHARNYIILGREMMLADCLCALVSNGKIAPLDAESAARFLNRLLLVYAMEDSLQYPWIDDTEQADEVLTRMLRDCTNFMNYILPFS